MHCSLLASVNSRNCRFEYFNVGLCRIALFVHSRNHPSDFSPILHSQRSTDSASLHNCLSPPPAHTTLLSKPNSASSGVLVPFLPFCYSAPALFWPLICILCIFFLFKKKILWHPRLFELNVEDGANGYLKLKGKSSSGWRSRDGLG